jgi:hypothetical protein
LLPEATKRISEKKKDFVDVRFQDVRVSPLLRATPAKKKQKRY